MLARIVLSLVLCSLVACGGNSRAPVEDRGAYPQDSAYTVKSGDTLYSISFRYGLDFRKVAAANGIGAPYTIYPGQRIQLDEVAQPAVSIATRAAPTTTYAIRPTNTRASTPATPANSPILVYSATAPAPVSVEAPSPAYRTSPEPVAPVAPIVAAPVPPTASQSYAAASEPILTPAPVAGAPPAEVKSAIAAQNYVGGEVKTWLWPTSGALTRGFSESVHKGVDISGGRGDSVVAVAAGKVVYAGTGIVGFGELLIIKHNEVYLSAYGHNDRLLVEEGETVAAGQEIAQKGSSGTDTVKLHFEIRKEGQPIDPQRLLPKR